MILNPYVTHLESAIDGTNLVADQLQTVYKDRPLWVRYNLDAVRTGWSKDALRDRPPALWRYRELLPPSDDDAVVSLGEGMTPLISCPRLAAEYGVAEVLVKDESQLPTGSFKSRGQALAVTMAKKFGVRRLAIPTNGNAGGAMAAYAACAGIDAYVFMPADTPAINQYEARAYGARAFLVDGLISDCGRIVREGVDRMGWFDVSTLREPYRIEGKKTMGLELAEQLDWTLPDVILYPTGGGTGLIGMWKAFQELAALGWISPDSMPKMVAVQSSGCCPIAAAYERGDRFAEPHKDAHTVASGIRVPSAIGDFMMMDTIGESSGCAVAVVEERILDWTLFGTRATGIGLCPETGACIGALESLSDSGYFDKNDRVVVFNTGALQKYPEAIATELPRIAKDEVIDWDAVRVS